MKIKKNVKQSKSESKKARNEKTEGNGQVDQGVQTQF